MSKELVLRSYKKYFFGIASSGGDTGTITWHRMKGFTNGTVNANSTEYNPHYIDDTFESSYLVGISESIDFEFDQMKGDTVHAALVDIIDNLKLGTDAIVKIAEVDFSDVTEGSSDNPNTYAARYRDYTVIPSSRGDGTDAYKYSGTFKTAGDVKKGQATISVPSEGATIDNVEQVTIATE